MQEIRDLAIVLRSIPYEERHRVVTALTETHGLITALARNSIHSRRFGGTLELLSASEWHFFDRPGAELSSLREATIRRSFEGIRKNFERLSLASVFSELMVKVAPHREPCPDLFRLHSNALAVLEEMQNEAALIPLLNGYFAKLLQWNGNQPQVDSCLSCQTPIEQVDVDESVSCRVENAGWICPNCRKGDSLSRRESEFRHSFLRVSPLAIRDFRISLMLPIRKIPEVTQAGEEAHRELFRYLEALFAFHVPGFDRKPLNALKFLGLESSVPPLAGNSPQSRRPEIGLT